MMARLVAESEHHPPTRPRAHALTEIGYTNGGDAILDRRIDLDSHQREVVQAATEHGVPVLVRSRDGQLQRLEQCRRAPRHGGLRLVPPNPDET